MKDILGAAILSWFQGNRTDLLWINNRYGEPEEMPIDHYFRSEEELPELEGYAISQCDGRILDVGAGAGAHALPLQDAGMEVHALEISPKACQVMVLRGVQNVENTDIFEFETDQRFDTILLMMNGIGLVQETDRLAALFEKLKSLLTENGQVLFDSSDVHYLYDNAVDPATKPTDRYYGEIEYQYEYQEKKGDWFKWLYIDFPLCRKIAQDQGFNVDLLAQDDEGQYLVRLTLN